MVCEVPGCVKGVEATSRIREEWPTGALYLAKFSDLNTIEPKLWTFSAHDTQGIYFKGETDYNGG